MTGEMVAFDNGVKGMGAQPRGIVGRRDHPRGLHDDPRRGNGHGDRPAPPRSGRRGPDRPRRQPLGEPIDNKGPIVTDKSRLVESPAPGIVDRQPVEEPMQTGIKAIDAMTPDRPRSARADHR